MAKKFLVPFILACMMMSACSGGFVDVDGGEVSDNFELDLVSSMNLVVGSSDKLILDVQPNQGSEVNVGELEVTWVNSNSQVISISDSKSTEVVVTGLASGDATVTAMVGNLAAASCRVNVSGSRQATVEVTGVSISEESKDFVYEEGGVNNSFGLIATVETNPATSSVNVTWSSTVTSVATVTPRGNNATINVLGPGETDIVASYGSFSARCKLSVTSSSNPVTISVSLNKQALSLEVGQSETLVETHKGEVEYIRWQSNNQGVATVSQSGLVTAVDEGQATISVSVSDGNETKTASCLVNVSKANSSSDYDEHLPAALKQKGHIYFHYLRTSDNNYDDWALWIWQSFPNSLEGSLWGANASHFSSTTPIKSENIQSLGYMTNNQVNGGNNEAYSDDFGRIIDVDLKADNIKGGKTGKVSPLISEGGWEQSILNKTDLGFLIVDQTKMTGESMWTSDGSGETFIKKLGKKYLTNGEDSYLHVYCVEGNVSNFTTTSGKQVVNNPTLTDTTGQYRSVDDQSLLTRDDYTKGVSTSTSFKQDRPGVGYQIFVPSYADSDGDGFGDLRGIINKLDYIKNDVGAEVLWLTPIQESNSYHGYDVTDYYKIDSRFGTIEDYQELLYRAHKLGMKVLMDMVINHTSKSNVLFKKSEAAVTEVINGKEINYRDMYLWKYKTDKVMVWDQTGTSTTVGLNNYKEVAVSSSDCDNQWFKDGTSDYYYFGKFGSGMAELNYNCQATRDYMTDMCKYWLSFGLDGFRLDAIKHIYLLGELDPSLKGTISGHTVTYDVGQKHYYNEEMGRWDDVPNDYSYDMEMNVLFWKQFSGSLKASYPNCFLVGENFDGWDARMAPFYEAIDSQFDFSTFYHLNERKEDAMGNSIEVSLKEYQKYRSDLINGAYTSNHDVARMLNHAAAHNSDVTQAYAGNPDQVTHHAEVNNSNKVEANNMARYYAAMTILAPGVSWIYYGDEIGMSGNTKDAVEDSHGEVYIDNGNNVDRWYRQPMRWATAKGVDGTVNYTFGGIEVLWDNYNQTLPTVDQQKADSGTMLNYFKVLCSVKNNDAYPTYGFVSGTGSINGVEGTAKFDVSDGTRTVSVFVNNTGNAINFSMMGYSLLGCSAGGSATSVPAHGFVVMKK